ncbi:hypothetical protein FO519_006447 [Halicephalobus sp. NKZ332]|nr:hypothetical protein FO519_006447 [Halicephalobus sp. NKZ332]
MWSNQQQNQSDVHQTGRFFVNSNYNQHQSSVVGSPPFIRLHPLFQSQNSSWQQVQCQQGPHQQVSQPTMQPYVPRPTPRFHHSQSGGYGYGHSTFLRKNESHTPTSQLNETPRPVVQGVNGISVSSPPIRTSSPVQGYSQLSGTVDRFYPTQGNRFRSYYYPHQNPFPYSRSPQPPSVYQPSPIPPVNQNVNREQAVPSSDKAGMKSSKPPTPEPCSQSRTKPLYPMLTRKGRKKLDEAPESYPHYPPLPPCYNYDIPDGPYEKPSEEQEQVIPLAEFENGSVILEAMKELRATIVEKQEEMDNFFTGNLKESPRKMLTDDEIIEKIDAIYNFIDEPKPYSKPKFNLPDAVEELLSDSETLPLLDDLWRDEAAKTYTKEFCTYVEYFFRDLFPTQPRSSREVPEINIGDDVDKQTQRFKMIENEMLKILKMKKLSVHYLQKSLLNPQIQIIDDDKPLMMILCFKNGCLVRIIVGCYGPLADVDPFSSPVSLPFTQQFNKYLIECMDKGFRLSQMIAFFLALFNEINNELWVGKERIMCPGCNDSRVDTPSVIVGTALGHLRIAHRECVGLVPKRFSS